MSEAASTVADTALVILLGPDHLRPAGGIGVAMSGFIEALSAEGLLDVVLTTYSKGRGRLRFAASALFPMLRAIESLRARDIVPVVYAHTGSPVSLLRKAPLLRAARLAGAHVMVQLHSDWLERFASNALSRAALRGALSPAHGICVLSPYWESRARSAGLRQPITVIPNPLPPFAEAAARRGWSAPASRDGLVVLCMTRLVRGKRVDVLLRALVDCPAEYRCVIAGDGPERTSLEKLAGALRVSERVSFHGWVSGEEKLRLLEECDVFCVPSVNESFGMGFLEAMAFGRPVVGVRQDALMTVARHEETGFLVMPDAPAETASALIRLASLELRERLGRNGQRWVLEQFSIPSVGRRIRGALPL